MHTHTHTLHTKTNATTSKGISLLWLWDEQGEGFRKNPMGAHEHKKMKSSWAIAEEEKGDGLEVGSRSSISSWEAMEMNAQQALPCVTHRLCPRMPPKGIGTASHAPVLFSILEVGGGLSLTVMTNGSCKEIRINLQIQGIILTTDIT